MLISLPILSLKFLTFFEAYLLVEVSYSRSHHSISCNLSIPPYLTTSLLPLASLPLCEADGLWMLRAGRLLCLCGEATASTVLKQHPPAPHPPTPIQLQIWSYLTSSDQPHPKMILGLFPVSSYTFILLIVTGCIVQFVHILVQI